MNINKIILITLLMVLLVTLNPSCSHAQTVTKDQLLQDIDYIVKLMEESHANPYQIHSKEKFINKSLEIKNRLGQLSKDTFSQIESYYFLQELVAYIQDGHTSVQFPFDQLAQYKEILPFRLKIIGKQLFIEENWGTQKIPLFSEIIKINHKDIGYYFNHLEKILNSALPQGRTRLLAGYLPVHLLTFFKTQPPWSITYKTKSEIKTLKVSGIPVDLYGQNMLPNTTYKESFLTVKGIEIPVLTIPNFSYGRDEAFHRFIDNFFIKHKNKSYLLIDLRNNPGGSGYRGFYLLDYLASTPYSVSDRFDFKVSDLFRTSGYVYKVGEKIKEAKKGSYLANQENLTRTPQSQANRFKGKTFLLVSDSTFSAGVVTAAIFKYYKMGTTIGQETAGGIQFNSDPVLVRLPNSQLSIMIPVAIYSLPGKPKNRGLIPDIPVKYAIEDYARGTDKEIEMIKKLVKK
jgi:hypothetical protein